MRTTSLVLVVLVLAGAGAVHAGGGEGTGRGPILAQGTDLSTNAGFEAGSEGTPSAWMILGEETGMQVAWGDHGIDGSKGMLYTAPPDRTEDPVLVNVSQRLRDVPRETEVELTAWLRLTDFEGTCVVWGRCDGAEGMERREGGYDNSVLAGFTLEGSTIWSPVTIRLRTGPSTRQIVWGVLVGGKGRVQLDEAHAVVRKLRSHREAAPRASQAAMGPGIYRAEGRYRVMSRGDSAVLRVRFPLPILWRDQIPLDLDISTMPAGHVRSIELVRRESGHYVADVVLENLEKGVDLRFAWSAHVLALPHESTPIPEGIELPLALEDVPAEVRPWLAGTWCCASDDEAVASTAASIREVGTVADVVVPATLKRMRSIFGAAEGRVSALTATEALSKRGSCTSCANLGAALLRAHGIPARVIAGYPTWSGPLQTHYVVEYWLPRGGWRLMESTRCEDDRPAWEQIEVALVLPDDEAEERAGSRKGAAPGVPWLTLTEYPVAEGVGHPPVHLVGDTARRGCDHEASLVARVKGDPDDWRTARALLTKRWETLVAAAVEDAQWLAEMAAPPAREGDVDSVHDLLEVYGVELHSKAERAPDASLATPPVAVYEWPPWVADLQPEEPGAHPGLDVQADDPHAPEGADGMRCVRVRITPGRASDGTTRRVLGVYFRGPPGLPVAAHEAHVSPSTAGWAAEAFENGGGYSFAANEADRAMPATGLVFVFVVSASVLEEASWRDVQILLSDETGTRLPDTADAESLVGSLYSARRPGEDGPISFPFRLPFAER